MQDMKHWGLVLSGGAAWGIANGGVLEVLEQEDLKPNCIAGSSMGAIVGAITAMGYDSGTMRMLLKDIKLWKIARMSDAPLKNGLHGGLLRHALEDHLGDLLGEASIGDCRIPFICIAGRIKKPIAWHQIVTKGFTEHAVAAVEPYVFPPETRLLDAILASSAIPVLFSPVTIGDDAFIDLCKFGAIPARTLKKILHPDIIIATDTSPRHDGLRTILPKPWNEFLDMSDAEQRASKEACDLVLTPTFDVAPYRFDRAQELYDAGIAVTRKNLETIRMLLMRP